MTSKAALHSAEMKIADPTETLRASRGEVYEALLPLTGARILELGCGRAELTRDIALAHADADITAFEIDRIQHEKNLKLELPSNVRLEYGGARRIAKPDASFDIVLMFRSLHHVPLNEMDQALGEIRRVLKPGGIAYFEEPVFAGEYNDIITLFHDERTVREAAFGALKRAVESGRMELVQEKFFLATRRFRDFAELEQKIRGETHTVHRLSPTQLAAVENRFLRLMTPDGVHFEIPLRIDLLRRPID